MESLQTGINALLVQVECLFKDGDLDRGTEGGGGKEVGGKEGRGKEGEGRRGREGGGGRRGRIWE